MMKITCEDFERDFADLEAGTIDPIRRKALEEHRHNCRFCQNFSAETQRIRQAMAMVPHLEASPHLIYNLRREISRIERGGQRPNWDWNPLPRFAALGTGFAIALVLGVLFLRSGLQPTGIPSTSGSLQVTDNESNRGKAEQPHHDVLAPQRELAANPAGNDLARFQAVTDTATHRLPEPAGKDSLPIPIENDFWKVDQVSTTPGGP